MPNNGIFSLSTYYNKDLSGDIPEKTRESYREYGYFGGGAPGPLSTVDRLDYSNDTSTASVRGPLSSARGYLSGTGNSDFGYTGGGSSSSTVDRIDYSNDNATASIRGPLSLARSFLGASGNSNFGYFIGGQVSGPVTDITLSRTTIDRINYSNDTSTASVRGPLNQRRSSHSSTGNSNFGWTACGNRAVNDQEFYSSTERIDYSNDSIITLSRSLMPNGTGQGNSATGNNNFGYYHRGVNPSGIFRTEINRIDYSNDLVNASVRTNLIGSNSGRSATGNSNFGYFAGGRDVSIGFTPSTLVERIDYANDTTISSIRGPLSLAKTSTSDCSSASFGGSPISQYGVFAKPFGYFGGGATPSVVSTIDRIDYSNDTSNTSQRNTLISSRSSFTSTGNFNFGYFGGGAPGPLSTVDRLDYLNDTTTLTTRGPLSLARQNLASTSTSSLGYFGGGFTSSVVSTVDRLSYFTDTSTASIRGFLSLARRNLASTGTSNFGYYGGGYLPSPTTSYSTIDRINYSNDNASALSRTSLLVAYNLLAATGNSNFGYFGGGVPGPVSTVYRLDYASDTSATSARGPLSSTRSSLSATGTSNFGYFGGGSGLSSRTDRVDYSNDTATATIRGSLTSARSDLVATSPTAFGGATDFTATSTFFDIQSMRRIEDTTNYSVKKRALGSYGYFGGGSTTLSRIDFSNDLATASSRAVVVITSSEAYTGTGNNNFGYFGGGYTPSPLGGTSTVGRVDYSNDSAICSIRGPLTTSLRLQSASGTLNFGYFAGGITSGTTQSIITRINYSNDLSRSVNRTTTRNPKTVMGFTSNNNFGYLAAGFQFPSTAYSSVDRINYSNDSSSTSSRGNLTSVKSSEFNFGFAATGNSNFGYFGGGIILGIGNISTVDRIDYSNDTATASVRGPLSVAIKGGAGTGNNNFGYFGGGVPGPVSTVDRIDYSNDTIAASARGSLGGGRTCATTNSRNS